MSENKRYVQFEFPYDDFAVRDNQTNEELWNPMIIDRLNEQDTTIKRLKTIREEQIQTILKQKRKIKELTVQLQTDDICSKCKHEYLVKRDDGYFIAKCKKGHNECSKGDIRFCEDFEFELGGDVKWD